MTRINCKQFFRSEKEFSTFKYVKPLTKDMAQKERDIKIFEVKLNDIKIKELIKKLNELKESKEHIHFDDKNRNHILFVHEETEIL